MAGATGGADGATGRAARRGGRSRRGAVAIVAAAMLVPGLVGVGLVIDYAHFALARSRLRRDLDGAVIAAVKTIASRSDAEIASAITARLAAARPFDTVALTAATVSRGDRTISASASVAVATTLTRLVGIDALVGDVASTATGAGTP
jgi:Flp pilus assembly protein TadG